MPWRLSSPAFIVFACVKPNCTSFEIDLRPLKQKDLAPTPTCNAGESSDRLHMFGQVFVKG
jgi:hypothetical protein